VLCREKFLSLLSILEAQWEYHTLKRDLADTLFEILEGWETGIILEWC
jgi:hypothetical protein